MESLGRLAKAALLGSERAPVEVRGLPGRAGELVWPPDENGVLAAAGLLALYRDAGFTAAPSDGAPPAPSPQETLAGAPSEAVSLLNGVLATEFPPLLADALRHLARKGWRVPAATLPSWLGWGGKHPVLRPLLAAVAGERGHWLARQNPEWAYLSGMPGAVAGGVDTALWEEGTLAERADYLRALRAADPDLARDTLAAAFASEPAKNRVALLAALADNLSMRDEAFLHEVLAERSKEVAKTAAGLLSRLPRSRLAQQALAALAACLRREGLAKKRWVIAPPETFSDEMQALGLQEEIQFGRDIGRRAGWLVQLITLAPLAWWARTLKETPAALYAQAQESEWKAALRKGWELAALGQRNPEWAAVFIQANGWQAGLADILVQEDLETVCLALLRQDDRKTSAHTQSFLEITLQRQSHWSAAGSAALLDILRRRLARAATDYPDYGLRNSLKPLACVLHPTVLPQALEGWPAPEEIGYFADAFAEFGRFARLRAALEQL